MFSCACWIHDFHHTEALALSRYVPAFSTVVINFFMYSASYWGTTHFGGCAAQKPSVHEKITSGNISRNGCMCVPGGNKEMPD